jgi:hypothetical protein
MEPGEWVKQFAEKVGVEPPGDREVEALLALASDAAHGSARTAAPIACWIAGRSGRPASELMDAAREVSQG